MVGLLGLSPLVALSEAAPPPPPQGVWTGKGQVGVGYRELRPESLTKNAAGAVISRTLGAQSGGVVGTAGVLYSQALTSSTTLTDKLLVEAGSSDTLVSNALALGVKISTKLSLSVGYAIQNNTSRRGC